MRYRILPVEEWGRLEGLISAQWLPNPETATAAVAEDDDGQIRGILFLQLQLHLEPLVLFDSKVSFKRLEETLSKELQDRKGLRYFAFISDPRVAKMAELCGMEQLDMQIWKKEIR